MADIPIDNSTDLRRKYKQGKTYYLTTSQYGVISEIGFLHKSSEHVLVGCKGDCVLRDIILTEIAKAKPACDFNIPGSKRDQICFYFKAHVGMNLQAYMRAALRKSSTYDDQKSHKPFFYFDINLTHEITIRIFPDGTYSVFSNKTTIYNSNDKTLFMLAKATKQAQHNESYTVSPAADFFMPLFRL